MTETKSGSECRKITNWQNADEVEEEDDEDGIGETKEEKALPKKTNGKRRDDHVGGEPLNGGVRM